MTMLKGLGNLGDMAKIMKQAQEMQSRMTDAQNRLDGIEVTGEAGAGLVKVTATAKGEVKGLSIDPSLFAPEEREVVEDLIVAAIQDAQARAAAAAQEEMGKITEGLNLPAGMKLPF
jgi:nucleoid-associated protein EbfC